MRKPSLPRRRALSRLSIVLALAALAAGVLPMAAAASTQRSTTGRVSATLPAPRLPAPAEAPAPTWSLVGTMDTQHLVTPNTVLFFYGVFWIGGQGAQFHPTIPASVEQAAIPSVRVPAAGSHTYPLVVHMRAATEATRFRINHGPPMTVPAGATTFEHVETVQTTGPAWWQWVIRNADNTGWFFASADVYVQTG